ncbi:hypothetical protein D3C81_1967530 [compost metagenome]
MTFSTLEGFSQSFDRAPANSSSVMGSPGVRICAGTGMVSQRSARRAWPSGQAFRRASGARPRARNSLRVAKPGSRNTGQRSGLREKKLALTVAKRAENSGWTALTPSSFR